MSRRPDAGRMRGWPMIRVVAAREVVERVRTRAFRISILLIVLLVAVVVVLPSVLMRPGQATDTVGLTGVTPPGLEAILQAGGSGIGSRIVVRRLEPADVEAALRDRRVDVVVRDGNELVVRRALDDSLRLLLSNATRLARLQGALAATGLNQLEANRLLDQRPLPVTQLEPSAPARAANRALAMSGIFFLYIALIFSGARWHRGS